jgi:hypothetical protein
MVRRVLVIVLVLGLLPLGWGCRDTGAGKQQASSRRASAAHDSLMKSYDPRKLIQEWVQATKGEGEGEKVKVYLGPSKQDLVIGQLNYGTYVLVVDQRAGWYGVRYYSPDGGEFYGWIRRDQTHYIGPRRMENEVIVVGDDQNLQPLTIEGADEEMRRILAVPYRNVEGRGGQYEKQFWGAKDPEGYDDLSLLNRVEVTEQAKQWVKDCQVKLSRLSRRAPEQYNQVLKAYYDALQWYVLGNKSQFTKMLRQADDKRNEFAQYFGN